MLANDSPGNGTGVFAQPLPWFNIKALLPEPQRPDSLLGRRLGPYELVQPLGSGGMGSVYLASRVDDYRQLVAIKLIKPGIDTPEIVQRFQTERQVLADLRHPNIAPLLDGGATDEGQPYFVMEYIDGRPLDRHCDANKLDSRRRAAILRTVCRAVHFAHERHVVHRDLKPGNILVTADGTPRVTDFGLAKRLGAAPEGNQTESGALLGTPSYMAPEQASARNREVGPTTDVYALGAVLYELLTGRPPFRGDTRDETLRQILHEEPIAPSRLQPRLARDLETVCLKCLEKEPARRYPSVAELEEDLGRFLENHPIRARPISAWRRGLKWVKRRPLSAALVATITLAVTALLGVSAWYNAELTQERDYALNQQEIAQQQRDEANRLKTEAQHQKAQADQLRTRAEETSADLEAALATFMAMHARTNYNLLRGSARDAENDYQSLRTVYEKLLGDRPANPVYRSFLAGTLSDLGNLYRIHGRNREALDGLQKALAHREQLVRDRPGSAAYQHDLGVNQLNLGQMYDVLNQSGQAMKAYREAVRILEQLAKAHPENPEYRGNLGRAHVFLGDYLAARVGAGEKPEESDAQTSRAVEMLEPLVRDHAGTPGFALTLGMAYSNKGRFLLHIKEQPAQALPWFEKATSLLEKLHRVDPNYADVRSVLSGTLLHRADAHARAEQWPQALKAWDRKFEVDLRKPDGNHRTLRACALVKTGDYRRAVAEVQEVSRGWFLTDDFRYTFAEIYSWAGAVVRSDGKLPEAERDKLSEEYAGRALQLLRQIERSGYFNSPESFKSLQGDAFFSPLQGREEYRKLVQEVGEKLKKKK
jgi:tetratricopeptide (TPR) repeat protein